MIFVARQLSWVRDCSEGWITGYSVPPEEWWKGAKDLGAARDPAQSSLSDRGQQRFCQRPYAAGIPHCQGSTKKTTVCFLTMKNITPNVEFTEWGQRCTGPVWSTVRYDSVQHHVFWQFNIRPMKLYLLLINLSREMSFINQELNPWLLN